MPWRIWSIRTFETCYTFSDPYIPKFCQSIIHAPSADESGVSVGSSSLRVSNHHHSYTNSALRCRNLTQTLVANCKKIRWHDINRKLWTTKDSNVQRQLVATRLKLPRPFVPAVGSKTFVGRSYSYTEGLEGSVQSSGSCELNSNPSYIIACYEKSR